MGMENQPVLVIMAAGMGSRYGGLKQMDPMDGRGHLIIDYSIYDALQAGFQQVLFVIREENAELFREKIGNRVAKHMKVGYVYQRLSDIPAGFSVPEGRTKPWGTGHAVLSAYFATEGAPFAVINADDFYGRDAFCRMYHFLENQRDLEGKYRYAMVGYQLKNTVTENGSVSRGVCDLDEKGYLKKITERTRIETFGGKIAFTEDDGKNWTELAPDTPVSMNFWGFSNSIMNELLTGFRAFLEENLEKNPLKCEYFLPSVVEKLLKEDRAEVQVLPNTDKWYGVTYKEDKEQVVRALADMREEGIYPEDLLD